MMSTKARMHCIWISTKIKAFEEHTKVNQIKHNSYLCALLPKHLRVEKGSSSRVGAMAATFCKQQVKSETDNHKSHEFAK